MADWLFGRRSQALGEVDATSKARRMSLVSSNDEPLHRRRNWQGSYVAHMNEVIATLNQARISWRLRNPHGGHTLVVITKIYVRFYEPNTIGSTTSEVNSFTLFYGTAKFSAGVSFPIIIARKQSSRAPVSQVVESYQDAYDGGAASPFSTEISDIDAGYFGSMRLSIGTGSNTPNNPPWGAYTWVGEIEVASGVGFGLANTITNAGSFGGQVRSGYVEWDEYAIEDVEEELE